MAGSKFANYGIPVLIALGLITLFTADSKLGILFGFSMALLVSRMSVSIIYGVRLYFMLTFFLVMVFGPLMALIVSIPSIALQYWTTTKETPFDAVIMKSLRTPINQGIEVITMLVILTVGKFLLGTGYIFGNLVYVYMFLLAVLLATVAFRSLMFRIPPFNYLVPIIIVNLVLDYFIISIFGLRITNFLMAL